MVACVRIRGEKECWDKVVIWGKNFFPDKQNEYKVETSCISKELWVFNIQHQLRMQIYFIVFIQSFHIGQWEIQIEMNSCRMMKTANLFDLLMKKCELSGGKLVGHRWKTDGLQELRVFRVNCFLALNFN